MSEKHKFIWIIFTASIIGVLLGYVLLTLILALSIYILWLIHNIENIKHWTTIAIDNDTIPDASGDFGKIISNIIKINTKRTSEKQKHQKSIVRFNEILRHFPYPTVIINAESEITWVSKSAAKILKLNRKKDIGIKIYNIVRDSNLEQNLSQKEQSEVQIIGSDERTILAIAISKISKNTRILSIRDVSERRHLENMRKNFVANASHELRTPLTIINGYLQILKEKITLEEKYQSMLDDAYTHSQLMSVLIEDLLTLSNLESNSLQHSTQEVINFEEVINEAIHNLYTNANFKDRIICNIDTDTNITAVRSQIYSIIFNLLENGLKYSDDKVQIIISQIDNTTILEVIDSGVGISEINKNKVLHPFYRELKKHNVVGTGLGLSIVQQAALNNNASLQITNNTPQGSIFTITFSHL